MIFTIDRVQFSSSQNRYFIFEFMEVGNIRGLLNQDGTAVIANFNNAFWNAVYGMIKDVEKQKLNFLREMKINATKIYIFYQKDIDCYVRIQVMSEKESYGHVLDFNSLQLWFRDLNNIDKDTYSKGLGTVRESNNDQYVTNLLRSLYNDNQFEDDNGLELTKHLLAGDSTRGIDFDLFQFIPSTNEYIIYEFLKNDSFLKNKQVHPMRYSWLTDEERKKKKDNKQKYIGFWRAKQFFNARLYLINYSDDSNDKVSISEVLNLNEASGFVEENKYCMSKNVFLGWLTDMNQYHKRHNNYLSDFRSHNYPKEFFENFRARSKDYGKEFDV
jgi:hypothetical protein